MFLTVEISGMMKLGTKGYHADDLPQGPGNRTAPAGRSCRWRMAPIEIIGKLVKPFALAVRLFGNMTAGHFVILSLFGIIFLFGAAAGLELGDRPHHRAAGAGDHAAGAVRRRFCRRTCSRC